ncbi:11091_t:CDS:2 [Cetraspora pellucida]|uniref:11091_t:CDS:1 n=1 Tax=Cetraspora pellucida TaxID=1433469 RepID=A0ACA9JYL0_9GLOM|nr:11091_t:CDS:2 [Cetraspora pellucida]
MIKHLLERCNDIHQDEYDNTDTSSKQEIKSILLFIRKKAYINYQLLKALISTNAPLLFVENAKNVQCNIQCFISDLIFLTLSGDGWTNISKNTTLGQVAAFWTWLHETVYMSSFTNNDFQNSLIIEIDNC